MSKKTKRRRTHYGNWELLNNNNGILPIILRTRAHLPTKIMSFQS